MKNNKEHKTKKLSIELFDPKLLKETEILDTDNMSDFDDDFDELEDGTFEISLDEFKKTLE